MNRGESEKFAWIDDFRPSKDDLRHVAVVDYPLPRTPDECSLKPSNTR